MSNKQSMSGQVIESVLAEEEKPVVFIPLTITTTICVPTSYLDDIESNTKVIRAGVENLALLFGGAVFSVDIK